MNIYQQARAKSGLTQEVSAERLCICVESLRMYETDRRIPPDDVVMRMSVLYGSVFLIYRHLWQTNSAVRSLLPDVKQMSLQQSALRLNRVLREFAAQRRIETLLDISEDGIIDEFERPTFDAIMSEMDEIVNVYYALRMLE